MATDPKKLEELARQLAGLTPEECQALMSKITDRPRPAAPRPLRLPRISVGTWTGGSLRREDLYGDDGR